MCEFINNHMPESTIARTAVGLTVVSVGVALAALGAYIIYNYNAIGKAIDAKLGYSPTANSQLLGRWRDFTGSTEGYHHLFRPSGTSSC